MNTCARAILVASIVIIANDLFAQGVVNFANRPLPDPPDRLVRDVFGQPITGSNFVAQLLYQDTTGAFVAHPMTARFYASSGLQGWWSGGSRTVVGAGGIGVPVNMQVRVWDGGPGSASLSFEEAMQAGQQWGTSDIFVYVERFSFPAANSDTYMVDFRGFTLIPEPSTWALLGIGVGFLLWRWRRKRTESKV